MVLSMSPRRSKGVDVWDPENSSRLATLEHDERVRTATLSADGSTIVTATEGGQVVVWTTPERLAAAR
jgi:WD40 repeat protein